MCYIRSTLKGISKARNVGIAAGNAPLVLFTDDDCRIDAEWVKAMVTELSDNGTWATFGRILPERGDSCDAEYTIPGIDLATKMSAERAIYARNRFNLGFGHGANMGVRREVLERLGGFDEALGAGGPLRSWEDREFGYRVLRAGGRIIYNPAALVYHRQWRSWRAVLHASRDYAIGAGAAAAKCLRSGDLGGIVLFADWLFEQGMRQVLSGLLKWQSVRKITLGLMHLIYPWKGLYLGLRHRFTA
ncbi:glycosyltransferase family 2 protein [Candidatus Gracilibacteria bacterium]|nr:glycosyltransferase family 2 protein [Candidatus Gracilibacteria bacterium]